MADIFDRGEVEGIPPGYDQPERGEGLLKSIGGVVLTLAAFHHFSSAANVLRTRASAGAARFLGEHIAAEAGTLRRAITYAEGRTHDPITGLMGSFLGGRVRSGGNYATMGDVLRNLTHFDKFTGTIANKLRLSQYNKAYSEYKLFTDRARTTSASLSPGEKAASHFSSQGAFWSGHMGKGQYLQSSIFQRLVGSRLHDIASNYAPSLFGAYVAEKALNILPMGGHEAKSPNFFNPIAVASDFAKFSIGFYPFHQAFNTIGSQFSNMKHGFNYAMMKGAEKVGPDRVVKAMTKLDGFVSQVLNKARETQFRVSSFYKAFREPVPPAWRNPRAWNVGNFGSTIQRAALEALRKPYEPKSHFDIHNTGFFRQMIVPGQEIEAIRAKSTPGSTMNAILMDEYLRMQRSFIRDTKGTGFLAKTLGLQGKKVGMDNSRKAWEMVLGREGLDNPKVKEAMEILANASIGKNVFEVGGRTLDLQKYHPKKLFKDMAHKAMDMGFHVPWPASHIPGLGDMGKIRPLHFMKLPLVLQEKVAALAFGPGIKEYGFDLGVPVDATGNTFFRPTGKDRGLFLNGKFWNVNELGIMSNAAQGGKLADSLHWTLVGGAGFGNSLQSIQAAQRGALQSGYRDIRTLMAPKKEGGAQWSKWRGWIHDNIFRPFEVFDKGESFLYKFRSNLTAHLTHSKIPGVFSEEIARALKASGGASIETVAKTVGALESLEDVMGAAKVRSFHLVNRSDVRKELFRGFGQLDVNGAKIDYNNMAELLDDKDQVVHIAKLLRSNIRGPRLGLDKIDEILTEISGQGLKVLDHPGSRYGKYELNKLQDLQKFIIEDHMIRSVKEGVRSKTMTSIIDSLHNRGLVSGGEAAVMNAWDLSARTSVALGNAQGNLLRASGLTKSGLAATDKLRFSTGEGRPILDAFDMLVKEQNNVRAMYQNIRPRASNFEGYKGTRFIPEWTPGEGNPYIAEHTVGNSAFLTTVTTAFSPYAVMERFSRVGSYLGVGLAPENYTRWNDYFWKGVMGKRVALGAALYASYQAVDTMVDANPMFDGTMLDEGVTVALAEQKVKASLAFARMRDLSGITASSKYFEGLMPGFTSLVPGAVVGSTIGMATGGVNTIMGMAAAGALTNRAMSSLGVIPDWTKSRDEMIETYSGRDEVPVRSGRWWEFGRTPYEGGKVAYWRPHWFPRLKAQAMYSPNALGSKVEGLFFNDVPLLGFNPVGTVLDPYHYERKHYQSRPYPESAKLGEDMAFVGPLFGSTVGSLIKPPYKMHRQELENLYNRRGMGWVNQAPGVGPNYEPGSWNNNATPENYSWQSWMTHEPSHLVHTHPAPESKFGRRHTIGETLYRGTEFAGLWGFAAESIFGGQPYQSDTVMANAGDITSSRRSYWNLNLGGMMGGSEYLRRFLPRVRTQTESFNPLRNKMPHWLPGGAHSRYFVDFQFGDPYTKISEGELRLPGAAYESAHAVKFSFTGSPSLHFGRPATEIAAKFLGLTPPMSEDELETVEGGTAMHEIIQNQLARSNMLVAAESHVWDPYTDVSGSIDAIIRRGREQMVVEIKTKSTEDMAQLQRPNDAHISQINAYLKMTKQRKGILLYVSREDPTISRAFDVYYSQGRWERDVAALVQARDMAKAFIASGKPHYAFEGYSYIDQLRVLADVAPYSDSYKNILERLNVQQSLGMLSAEDVLEKRKIIKHRDATMDRYQLYPYRFAGKVMSPDSEFQNLSTNLNMKAASEYSLPERVAGSLWEKFTHMNTPWHTKFIQYRSPVEAYERTRLYGREAAFWNQPNRDFIQPYTSSAISTDSPFEGALRGALVGNVFLGGGMAATALSSIGLSSYGLVHGMIRESRGDVYISNQIKKQREVDTYFDRLQFLKAQRLYAATGDDAYAQEMGETMIGLNPHGITRKAWTNMYRAIPYGDRPFFDSFLRTTDPEERSKITKIVSPEVSDLLRTRWAQGENENVRGTVFDRDISQELGGYFKGHNLPPESWLGWHPDVQLDDIKVKTAKKEGLDAHDFGLGWYEQERRISQSPWIPGPVDMSHPTEEKLYSAPLVDRTELSGTIRTALSKLGLTNVKVSIQEIPAPPGSSVVNVKLRKSFSSNLAQATTEMFGG